MCHRTALPSSLGDTFSVRAAAAAGVRPGRRNARDLHRPFRGVRSTAVPDTFLATAQCCAERMRGYQLFSRTTAARLWGLPMRDEWDEDERIDIVVPTGSTPPRSKGIRGARLQRSRVRSRRVKDLPVVDPVTAVFTCAQDLDVAQAIIMLDALLTDAENYPGLDEEAVPLAARHEVEQRLDEWGAFPGHHVIREALPLAREHVESPKETETRRLLVAHGLPEPAVQHTVVVGGRVIGRVDLAYPQWKIAIEYDGDGHRTKKSEWRRDIRRQRELEAAGWRIIHLTQDDLGPALQTAFIALVRQAIRERAAAAE